MLKCLLVVLLVAACAASARTPANGCPSYEGAVDFCQNVTRQSNPNAKCSFWACVFQFCDAPFVAKTFASKCSADKLPPQGLAAALPSGVALKKTVISATGTPDAASPCGGGSGAMSTTQIRHWLLDVAMDVYYDRADEHYTEGSQRWSGITGKVCPKRSPPYSDCSSTVTWIYWTLFGNGPDFLNGENWQAGYTGTLDQHGSNVPVNTADLAVGDLCFYYHPMHHVAIYVGGGKVVSHGMDPVGYYAYDYAPVDFCRRYI
jgi:hypothetical protein